MLTLLLRKERGVSVVPVLALLDSGAQETLLPLQIADELGLSKDELNKDPGGAKGVESRFATWRTPLPVYGRLLRPRIAAALPWGPDLRLRPVFAETDVSLLGRADFFPHFRITFETDPVGPIFHLDA